ncbi:MAG TPA: TolC family protein [Steroidobacteraceae bacterium]|jgi:outer membrane protein TolC|nr:TolC family protein [Steroidobacteraceae bacterium]
MIRVYVGVCVAVVISAPAALYASPSDEVGIEAASPLTMQEAARLAAVDQPLLTGREAKIRAEEQQAVAAAQLPDPQLSGGIKELPVDTSEALSTRRDNFTEFTIGLSQEFPRAEKRRLQGARKQLDADADRAALDNERRMVRRDASLAWLDVYETQQGLKLTQRLADEATLQVQSLENDYRIGRASQADWFAAKTDAGLAADKAHDWLHHQLRMREGLVRWIGDDAHRPIAESLATSRPLSPLPALIADADHHPVIGNLDKQIEASATEVALARQSYKPDYSVEVYYAYRRDFSDFVGVQFKMGLPYFTKNRQDRGLEAALEQSRASEDRKQDLLRELHTQVNQDYVDQQHYQERVADFDASIIPDAEHRVEAARSGYQSGRGTFEAVLLARRGLLDIQLQRLALAVESARAQVRLDYWSASQSPSGDSP